MTQADGLETLVLAHDLHGDRRGDVRTRAAVLHQHRQRDAVKEDIAQDLPFAAALAGCDAGDTIDYLLTVSNTGHYNAYNVLLDDDGGLPAGGYGGLCTLLGVTDGGGTAVATSGNLFDTSAGNGLLVATIPADSNGTLDPTEILLVKYRCTIQIAALPSLPTVLSSPPQPSG